MEVFLRNPFIISKIAVEHLLLRFKHLCEVFNHSAHIQVRQVNENYRTIRLSLFLDHSPELVNIGVHSELNIESSFEHLCKVVFSHLGRD